MALPLLNQIVDLPLTLAWFPSTGEWIIIAAFGLILFGKRLPEVGRSLGKGIVEFKKGLKGVEEEIDEASNHPVQPKFSQTETKGSLPSGAKFDPYTGKPIDAVEETPGNAEPGKAV